MDLGRLSTILPARPAYPQHPGPVSRDAGPRPVEPASPVAPERDSYTRTRPAEPVMEGELLRRRPGFTQSTEDFLSGRQYQAGSVATQHGAGRGLSNGNRQALGLYLDNIHPEPRHSFTTGRSVDAFV